MLVNQWPGYGLRHHDACLGFQRPIWRTSPSCIFATIAAPAAPARDGRLSCRREGGVGGYKGGESWSTLAKGSAAVSDAGALTAQAGFRSDP